MVRKKKPRNVRPSIAERRVSIEGPISAATATNFEKQLAKLAAHGNSPIVVFFTSHGGDLSACLAIYWLIINLVKKQVPVHTVGVATAQSGAFFLLQAGVRRCATKNTVFRFHRVLRTYHKKVMNSALLEEEVRQLDIIDTALCKVYVKRSRHPRTICGLFMRDARINTKTALKLGLVDAVIPRGSFSRMRADVLRLS